jgi:soluble lytic murein transglycosylase-like protein
VSDPFDPQQNIEGGTRLLRRLLNAYDGNLSLALAAYNAGMGAVKRYGGIPPYRQTQVYVQRVLQVLRNRYDWRA